MAKNAESNVVAYNTVNVVELQSVIRLAILANTVPFIAGPPGVGKSEIIESVVASAGYALLDRRVSYMLPEDFFGLPLADKDNRESIQLKPSIIADVERVRAETGRPVVVLLDEITSAQSPGVYAALYQFILNRCLGSYCLPDDTRLLCAGNRAEDKGVVTELPMPLANRMQHFAYSGPTWDEFETWAITNEVHPHVLAFLKQQPQYVCGKIAESMRTTKDGRLPTPRAWALLSRQLHIADAHNVDHAGRLRIAASWVGDEASLRFETVMRLAEKLVSFEEVVKSPTKAPVYPEDLAASYLMLTLLVQRVGSQKDFDAVFTYVERMPKELIGIFFRTALRSPRASQYLRREKIKQYAEFASAGIR